MSISKMEKAIIDSIDRQEVIDLELGMVSIPSFTSEESKLAHYLYDYMKGFGLKAELEEVPLEGVRPDMDLRGKSSHMPIGKIEGSGGEPSLLFFGHMDHGPILGKAYWDPSGWNRDPFKPVVEEPYIYGKGCQDEKGGICAFITAAKAMVRADFKPKGDIYFIPVPGHKRVSFGTRHLLHKYKQGFFRPGNAVNSENSGMGIVPVFVGRSEGTIHIKAMPLHFATKERNPELRYRRSVFEQMTRFLQALGPEMMPPSSDTWMTFKVIKELGEYPQIRLETVFFHDLDHIELNFQIRIVPGMTDVTIKADLQRLINKLKEEDPHTDIEVDWPVWPTRPGVNTPYDSPLVKNFTSAYKDLVNDPPLDLSSKNRMGGSADGSHTFGAGIPTILLGPGGGRGRAFAREEERVKRTDQDERILIDDIVNCAKIFAIGAARLCG